MARRVCFLAVALVVWGIVLVPPVLAQTADDADALNAQVVRLYGEGKYAEAIPLAERALAIREKALGPEHPSVAAALNNLALLYESQGRYAQAEPLYKRALAIYEKALGPQHPDIASSLNNLAALYWAQGRYAQAEPLLKRSLAILETALGPEHPHVATALNNLAELCRAQGRTAEAGPLYKRALAIRERVLGPEHPDVGQSLNNLAGLYWAQGRYAQAEPLYKRSLAILEKVLGPEHPHVATALNNLAFLYRAQGRTAEAGPLYQRSLAIVEKALGPQHPDIATALNNLAWLALAQNDLAGAAESWRRATVILQRRAERGLGDTPAGSSKGEAQRNSWYFEGLVKVTQRLAAEGRGDAQTLGIEMFKTAQWAAGSEAAASLAQMAARSAGGSPALAALVRERQDLVAEWQANDKILIAARGEAPDKRDAQAEKALADRLAAIDTRLAEIDAVLAKDFPDYAALASPNPVSLADVQAVLHADEALVLFLDTDARFKPLPEETFIWVVTKRDSRWVRSDLGTSSLKREVAALRCGLDAAAWAVNGARGCTGLLSVPAGGAPKGTDPLPFDHARAHRLYEGLFGEVEDLIKGKHLLIVPSGALTRLPFQVLVTAAPKSTEDQQIAWLIRDHAVTVLPAVSSLKALRGTAKPSAATKPMVGFGNPLLDGNQKHPRFGAYFKTTAAQARAQTGCADPTGERTASLRGVHRSIEPLSLDRGIADLAHIRMQAPLPETADELCAVARDLNTDFADIRLGANATEHEVKSLSASGALADYRVVHFATHGALAGQLRGSTEPGLILTPPSAPTEEDDGYLSASEIAGLKLDADWVILSACNTAGGDDSGQGAQALSGLARAFFYAQARALLVSHWAVKSQATVKLISGAVGETARDPTVGRSEALRRAMLALIDKGTANEQHPQYWAPFIVVGEGGAAR